MTYIVSVFFQPLNYLFCSCIKIQQFVREHPIVLALMKRRGGSRGITVRDRPPGKLRHASRCSGSHQVFAYLSTYLPTSLVRPSNYLKIFAAPSDFFSSIFSLCRRGFRTRIVCFVTLWDSILNMSALLAPRCLAFSDKLAGPRVPSVPEWKQVCPRRNISIHSVFEIHWSALRHRFRGNKSSDSAIVTGNCNARLLVKD